jgi:hypothetical protein
MIAVKASMKLVGLDHPHRAAVSVTEWRSSRRTRACWMQFGAEQAAEGAFAGPDGLSQLSQRGRVGRVGVQEPGERP